MICSSSVSVGTEDPRVLSTGVLQIGNPEQRQGILFRLKPFIYGLFSDLVPEPYRAKTLFATTLVQDSSDFRLSKRKALL